MGNEIAVDAPTTPLRNASEGVDPRRCEIVLELLARKWAIPILVELEREPRRRQYLFVTLRISSARLDPTIQCLTMWGLIDRTLIPCGRTDGLGLAITDLGRTLLATLTRLSEWQHDNHSELLANNEMWKANHDPGHP